MNAVEAFEVIRMLERITKYKTDFKLLSELYTCK
jgi:hypothetical protein